ncbi:MAG: glycosyltransferase family 2 protein [Candidatus Aminicenantes bacterium]|nr:glycosyltransferase family 2 protein [Candidatus Aminicenantes bacterium]
MKKIAIIPAFNEERNIEGVILSLRQYQPDFDIVVINDGSTDETSTIARKTGQAVIIDLPANVGIGGAVQTGFLYSLRKNYDLAIQIDGDGQHEASEIQKIIEPILTNQADMVIGSRFLLPSKYRSTWLRRLGIKIFSLLNLIFLGEKFTDSTSGFRAFNRRAIEILSREYPDDFPEPEAIFLLKKKGLRIVEVPVSMKIRQSGKSSLTFFRSIYYMIKVLLAISVSMLRK